MAAKSKQKPAKKKNARSADATKYPAIGRISTGRRRGSDDDGELCGESPLCYEFDIDYDLTTITLTSIDLYDPVPVFNGKVWKTYVPPYTADASAAALAALNDAAASGQYLLGCASKECTCKLTEKWTEWSPAAVVNISGKFSIPAPNPPPKKLRYRANGTVSRKTRMRAGLCYRPQA